MNNLWEGNEGKRISVSNEISVLNVGVDDLIKIELEMYAD